MILDNVKRLCSERGISIFALEHILGFGNGTITKWDKTSPNVTSIKKVADYFGVTVDQLLT